MIIVIGSFALIWMGLRSGHGVAVENNTPLILAPTGTLVDQLDEDPGKRIFDSFNGAPPAQSSLRDLISAIEDATTDARIPFAVLPLAGPTSGRASVRTRCGN